MAPRKYPVDKQLFSDIINGENYVIELKAFAPQIF